MNTCVRWNENKRYEKDVVDECQGEPKLFYKFINGKIKHIKNRAIMNENKDPNLMNKILKMNFHSVYNRIWLNLKVSKTREKMRYGKSG